MAIEYSAVDLPGKSLYDKDFIIKVRKITALEQKYLLTIAQKEQDLTIAYLNFIKNLIVFDNPEMTFEQLYWFDVQYLLYQIRYTTYNKFPIKLKVFCNKCNTENEVELDIGALTINEPDLNKAKTIILDNLGETPIRTKIMQDELDINTFIKLKKLDENDYGTRLLLFDLCLIANGKSLNDMFKLVEEDQITANDIITIENWFKENIWGIEEKISTTCNNCKKEVSKEYILSLEDYFSVI